MMTIKLTDGCLGMETLLVRCDLAQAAAPVMADYCNGQGWQGTQYQCADARHTTSGLAAIGQLLAEEATAARGGEGEKCDWEEVNTVYIVRDASGEYISGKADGQRTPAADEAREYETRQEAEAACERETDGVLSREV